MSSEAQTKQTLLGEDQESRNQRRSGMNTDNDEGGGFPWLAVLGFAFLTVNSGMAIYRSERDLGSILFVGGSYADLVLLFVCLRLFEKAPRESPRRWWLKACVWALTTLLTVMFSHKVAAIMPPLVALVVWAMAFATIAGGFYAFFIYQDKATQLDEANRN